MNLDPWFPPLADRQFASSGPGHFHAARRAARSAHDVEPVGSVGQAAAGGRHALGRLPRPYLRNGDPLLAGARPDTPRGPLPMLFVTLSAVLWLVTTIYAIGYLEGSPNRSRFFGFFSLCVSSTVGIAMAGDLFTFLMFYEMLTLTTYPLVVHRGTKQALRAGRTYLAYTLGGSVLLLLGIAWLYTLTGDLCFQGSRPARRSAGGIRADSAADLRHAGPGVWRQGRVGAAARLAAASDGCPGPGQCPASCGRRCQGRGVRNRPDRERRLWDRVR